MFNALSITIDRTIFSRIGVCLWLMLLAIWILLLVRLNHCIAVTVMHRIERFWALTLITHNNSAIIINSIRYTMGRFHGSSRNSMVFGNGRFATLQSTFAYAQPNLFIQNSLCTFSETSQKTFRFHTDLIMETVRDKMF